MLREEREREREREGARENTTKKLAADIHASEHSNYIEVEAMLNQELGLFKQNILDHW
jgi:hypothetical protein